MVQISLTKEQLKILTVALSEYDRQVRERCTINDRKDYNETERMQVLAKLQDVWEGK